MLPQMQYWESASVQFCAPIRDHQMTNLAHLPHRQRTSQTHAGRTRLFMVRGGKSEVRPTYVQATKSEKHGCSRLTTRIQIFSYNYIL